MKESILAVQKAVIDLDIDGITGVIQRCLDDGISSGEIVQDGISKGLTAVGVRFEEGEYFLADLVMSGEVVKEGMLLLEGKIDPDKTAKKGKVILATVKGDIHEIGKSIVGMMLSASGFEVIDLGVDVSPDKIVETVKQTGAPLIGLSTLLTTMVGSIKDTVDAITEAGLREKVKIAIGGACTSEQLADEMGADAYGATAVQAVKIFENMLAAH